MIKKILVSILSIILVGGIIFISTNSNKVSDKENIDDQKNIDNEVDEDLGSNTSKNVDTNTTANLGIANIFSNICIKSIFITKANNGLFKKNITSAEDKKELLDFINSITLKEKLNDNYKGWSYSIDIEDTNNKSYGIGFLGDKLSIDNTFYTVDSSVCDNVEKLYNKFNYPETNPLK